MNIKAITLGEDKRERDFESVDEAANWLREIQLNGYVIERRGSEWYHRAAVKDGLVLPIESLAESVMEAAQ